MTERLKWCKTASWLLAAPLAVLIAVGPARASPNEANVQVNINVEPFAEIITQGISVHLELTDPTKKTAYSTPITVQANAWFDAILTVEEGQLVTAPSPWGGRLPYGTGQVHGEHILYSPNLVSGPVNATWDRNEEQTWLEHAVPLGVNELLLEVGIESWMTRTPSGGWARADTYMGSMILTLVPSGSAP